VPGTRWWYSAIGRISADADRDNCAEADRGDSATTAAEDAGSLSGSNNLVEFVEIVEILRIGSLGRTGSGPEMSLNLLTQL
jgi:hypothetical protein